MTEDKKVGWHHQINGHEFEQAPGDGEGQGRLACCSPWGHKELDMTQRLNNEKTTLRVDSKSLLSVKSFFVLLSANLCSMTTDTRHDQNRE